MYYDCLNLKFSETKLHTTTCIDTISKRLSNLTNNGIELDVTCN